MCLEWQPQPLFNTSSLSARILTTVSSKKMDGLKEALLMIQQLGQLALPLQVSDHLVNQTPVLSHTALQHSNNYKSITLLCSLLHNLILSNMPLSVGFLNLDLTPMNTSPLSKNATLLPLRNLLDPSLKIQLYHHSLSQWVGGPQSTRASGSQPSSISINKTRLLHAFLLYFPFILFFFFFSFFFSLAFLLN